MNLIGVGFAVIKSVQMLSEQSSPKILIFSGSEQPKPICSAVVIIGMSCGSKFMSLQQMVSAAIGSVEPMSQPRSLALPLIGPWLSIATTPSIMVRAG